MSYCSRALVRARIIRRCASSTSNPAGTSTAGRLRSRYLLAGLSAAARRQRARVRRGRRARGGRPARAADVVALPMRGDLDCALVGRLRRVLRRLQPDLVHVHSRRGADLYGGVAAAARGHPGGAHAPRRLRRARRLGTPQVPAVCADRRDLACDRGAARAHADRACAAHADSERGRRRPPPARRDARGRLLARFDLPRDALLVGVVAQLIPRKRHGLLLGELPAIVRREPRVRVLCFGRGPLEMALRAQIAALGLERHVLLAGFRDDLPALLPGLDVLVHPAEREGLGVAVLEAASCARARGRGRGGRRRRRARARPHRRAVSRERRRGARGRAARAARRLRPSGSGSERTRAPTCSAGSAIEAMAGSLSRSLCGRDDRARTRAAGRHRPRCRRRGARPDDPERRGPRALALRLGRALLVRRARVATAESCTGGWIAKALTDVPGSSQWFESGIVAYSNAAKDALLGIPSDADREARRGIRGRGARDGRRRARTARRGSRGGRERDRGAGRRLRGQARRHGLARVGRAKGTTAERRVFAGDREAVRRQSVALALQGLLELVWVDER